MPDSRRGLIFGALAYILWGTFPLYWTLLEPAGALEILAHRIVWSVLTMLVILVLARRVEQFRALLRDRRRLLLISCAAVVITVNWGGYIWGVNNGRVVETSLGYFINPLVTVLMGVLALVSGVMGMNFQAPFFDTGAAGFYTVITVMVVISALATWVAWRRGWIGSGGMS